MNERLNPQQLRESLGKTIIGGRIIVLERTRSTNDFLRQMLTPELPEGTVVFAEEQTGGRGQHGRQWASAPHQGLWFSFLLRPQIPLAESARLTDWAAQAVAATIAAQTGLQPTLKPPNDVYIDGRKVAGVLVETKAGRGAEFSAIVGIGLNVGQGPEDFPEALRGSAVSLAQLLGKKVDRSGFAVALLRELERTREGALGAAL